MTPTPSDASQAVELPPLLPCPFCGCKAVWFKTGRDIGIECEDGFDCPGRAQTNVYEPQYRQDVIAQWNRRVLPTGEDIRELADYEDIDQDRAARAQAEPVAYLVDWADIGEGASRSLFYDEEAKKHMEGAVSHGNNIGRPSVVTPLYAAPTIPQAAEVPGEWTARKSMDGLRVVIDSADFEHDMLLTLTGDFESEAQKLWIAGALADKLNAAAPTPTASAPKAEAVTCERCGHENWIMEGKAPCQITTADKQGAQAAPKAEGEAVAMGSVLQRVMARLANMLDENQFNEIEGIVDGGGFAAPSVGRSMPTHRHIRRGGLYTELHRGVLQTDVPLTDMMELVAYWSGIGECVARLRSLANPAERHEGEKT